jgi:hypothetical protein
MVGRSSMRAGVVEDCLNQMSVANNLGRLSTGVWHLSDILRVVESLESHCSKALILK